MTEHIVTFAVGLDDDAIVESIQKSATRSIINDIKVEILNKVFKGRYYNSNAARYDEGRDKVMVNRDAEFSSFAETVIKETINDNKDEIIERAAQLLCESYKRTKAWKDKAGDVIDGD